MQHIISGCPHCKENELVKTSLPQVTVYSLVDVNPMFLQYLSLKLEESYTIWTVSSKKLSYVKLGMTWELDSPLLEQVRRAEKVNISAMSIQVYYLLF